MQFANPLFLFALTAVSIPILIHLFYFRKHKTVYYSNIKLLKSIQNENQTKTQLKHWFILLARIFAITALVFAFAQPFIPSIKNIIKTNGIVTGIYIDNSYSMDAEGSGGILLEEAKMKARQIAAGFPASSKFMVLTNDFEAIHHQIYSREQLPNVLAMIKSSAVPRTWNDVVKRLVQNASKYNQGMGMSVFLISDFQKITSRFDQMDADSNVQVIAIPVSVQQTPNTYIDSCWFATPTRYFGTTETMNVKLKNLSDSDISGLQIQLFINDSLKNLITTDMTANSEKTVQIKFNSNSKGFQKGKIEINDFPITFDNIWYFSYQILTEIKINEYYTNKPAPYLNALFKDDPYIKLHQESLGSINLEILKTSQLNVFSQADKFTSGLADELYTYMGQGGNVFIIPSKNANLESYNYLFAKCKAPLIEKYDTSSINLDKISVKDPIFSEVFKNNNQEIKFTDIKGFFVSSANANPRTLNLLIDVHQRAMLTKTPVGKGMLYIIYFPCGDENKSFIKSAIYTSFMYNIAMFSQPYKPVSYTCGLTNTVQVDKFSSEKQIIRLVSDKNKIEILPIQRNNNNGAILSMDEIKTNGHFYAKTNGDTLQVFSFNYNRLESDLTCYGPSELMQKAKEMNYKNFTIIDAETRQLEKEIQNINEGTQLWKWFILLAIFFLFMEMVLIRFWK